MMEVESFYETSCVSCVLRVPALNQLYRVCCNDLTVVTGRVERSAVDCNESRDYGFSIFGQSNTQTKAECLV
jgi:hypothetical protein